MSAIVVILPKVSPDGDESQRGRETQELRMALAALAGNTPPRARPVLAVDNERVRR
jgi:hypothetical protein